MSRKHNTRHPDRGISGYPRRLLTRGLTKAPTMESVENLRARQGRRIAQTGSPFPTGYDEAEQEAA